LPRCARRCGIPLVSFDHQHFLLVSDLSDLPWSLRWKAWLLRPSIRLCYGGAHRMIVSSFYFPPKRHRYRDAVQVGPLLRPEIESACPIQGDYVLVYVRRAMPRTLERALRECGRPVRVYGLGCREPAGNLIFCATDQSGFAADLAGCCAVVATAGNQLVGEAFYLGKPVLGLPEPGNFEQSINGYFLRASGAGESIDMGRLTPADLQEFLQRVPEYRSRLRPHQVKGNELAVAAILGELQRAQASTGLVQCAA
ncbi:MAG: glycosyltransferase family protein, partial [Pirellulaceae bacterium]